MYEQPSVGRDCQRILIGYQLFPKLTLESSLQAVHPLGFHKFTVLSVNTVQNTWPAWSFPVHYLLILTVHISSCQPVIFLLSHSFPFSEMLET